MGEQLEVWTGENLPGRLVQILDAEAGKIHSSRGAVRASLAKILNAYDRMFIYDEDPAALAAVWDRLTSTVEYTRQRETADANDEAPAVP